VTGSAPGTTPEHAWRAPPAVPLRWRWSDRDEHRMLLVAAGAVFAFGLAGYLLPRSADFVHAFEHGLGFMAPTCGLTRAGLALLSGDPATAWTYNPAIFLVAPPAVAMLGRFAVGSVTGRWLTVRVQAGPVGRALGVALVVALWLNQQAHFALLAR